MYNEALKITTELSKLPNPPTKIIISILLLEKYVNGAIMEWEQIQSSISTLRAVKPTGDYELKPQLDNIFLHIHFFFICAEKAQNMVKFLSENHDSDELKSLWESTKNNFRPFNDARNHLEHIETRMNENNFRDFGNLSNDTFTFAGERFDIGDDALRIITDLYEKIISHLDK